MFLKKVVKNGKKQSHFHCGICFSNRSTTKAWFPFQNCKTQHFFCKSCMKQYIENQIKSGQVPIRCPASQCFSVAKCVEVRALVCESQYIKYARFMRMKSNPRFRECGSCMKELNFRNDNVKEVKCECGIKNCFEHGNWIKHVENTSSRSQMNLKVQDWSNWFVVNAQVATQIQWNQVVVIRW